MFTGFGNTILRKNRNRQERMSIIQPEKEVVACIVTNFFLLSSSSCLCNSFRGVARFFISLRQNWGYSGSRGHNAMAKGRVRMCPLPRRTQSKF